jgi:hypothetical protein
LELSSDRYLQTSSGFQDHSRGAESRKAIHDLGNALPVVAELPQLSTGSHSHVQVLTRHIDSHEGILFILLGT